MDSRWWVYSESPDLRWALFLRQQQPVRFPRKRTAVLLLKSSVLLFTARRSGSTSPHSVQVVSRHYPAICLTQSQCSILFNRHRVAVPEHTHSTMIEGIIIVSFRNCVVHSESHLSLAIYQLILMPIPETSHSIRCPNEA